MICNDYGPPQKNDVKKSPGDQHPGSFVRCGNHSGSVQLLTVFAKNEKVDLSVQERRMLISAAKALAADYRRDP